MNTPKPRRRVIKGLKTWEMPCKERARYLLTHARMRGYDYHTSWNVFANALDTDYNKRQLDRFERHLIKQGIAP